jgi:hypothetical protein
MPRQEKITLGEMRASGPSRLLIYCADYRCSHSVVIDADRWPDHVHCPISSRSLPAGLAVTTAPMSGRCLR